MEFLYVFFIIWITSITLTIIFKKRIEQVIPIAILIMILIIYIAGLWDYLSLGVLLLCITTLIQLIAITIYFSKRINEVKTILSRIVTPGFIIYIGLFIISMVFNKGRIFENYDEYNHWGIMVKNMFLYDTYGTNPESIVAFNEYPPFTSIFQYLLIQIKGIYAEDVIITAQNILYFSMVIPITKNITWKNDIKRMVLSTILILFLPMIFYANFYTDILVDGILGVAFSYTIYSAYRKEENIQFQFLEIFCGITILMLTKTQGIGLAILAIILIVMMLLRQRKTGTPIKKKVILLITVILLSTLLLTIWYGKVKQVQHRWDLNKIYQIDEKQEQEKQVNQIITKEFINAVIKGKMITQRNLTTLCVIIGIFILAALLYGKIEKSEKKKYLNYTISILISTIIYLIGMLWMYCTIFDKDEALILASFPRYIFTIVLADILCFSFVLLEQKIKVKQTTIILILVVILMPFHTINQKYINKNEYIMLSNKKRWEETRTHNI